MSVCVCVCVCDRVCVLVGERGRKRDSASLISYEGTFIADPHCSAADSEIQLASILFSLALPQAEDISA